MPEQWMDRFETLLDELEAAGEREAAYCLNVVLRAVNLGQAAALQSYLQMRPDDVVSPVRPRSPN